MLPFAGGVDPAGQAGFKVRVNEVDNEGIPLEPWRLWLRMLQQFVMAALLAGAVVSNGAVLPAASLGCPMKKTKPHHWVEFSVSLVFGLCGGLH